MHTRTAGWIMVGISLTLGFSLAPAAGAELLELVQDVGALPETDEVPVRFTWPNTDDAAWAIVDIKAPCACTVVEHTTESVPPGGLAEVGVVYTPSRAGRLGRSRRLVVVRTTSPSHPWVHLQIDSLIYDPRFPLMAEPSVVSMTPGPPGADRTATITLRRFDGRGFGKITVESTPGLRARVVSDADAPDTARLHLSAHLPESPGDFRAAVVLRDPGYEQALHIDVGAPVLPTLLVKPQRVFFGTLHLDDAVGAELTVRRADGAPFVLEPATSAQGQLTFAARTDAPAKEHRVRMTLAPGEPTGRQRARIRLRAAGEPEPGVEVPVVWERLPYDRPPRLQGDGLYPQEDVRMLLPVPATQPSER